MSTPAMLQGECYGGVACLLSFHRWSMLGYLSILFLSLVPAELGYNILSVP